MLKKNKKIIKRLKNSKGKGRHSVYYVLNDPLAERNQVCEKQKAATGRRHDGGMGEVVITKKSKRSLNRS